MPFYKDTVRYFLEAITRLEGVELGVITQDPLEVFPLAVQQRLLGHWRVQDSLDPDQLQWAAGELARQFGAVDRLLTVNEHAQLPLAVVRDRLGLEGMSAETIRDFRDKSRMKQKFREHGVPCARHCGATSEAQAWEFIEQNGFPVCVKPVDGAAAQATYRVDDANDFREVLRVSAPSFERPLQIEEFVVGEESSFETMSLRGKPMWHSLTHYQPTPLSVLSNPWIQWKILLPREIDEPVYDDIREHGCRALESLGMDTGLTHLEWFRRPDGSVAVSEVAARPPGAQILTMMNRANDIDLYDMWARLMLFSEFEPPKKRKFAVGTAFLRGLGGGRVKGVHGLSEVLAELGDMVTDLGLPQPGQEAGTTYEGDGFVIVRHPETEKVQEALDLIVSRVRVELVH